MVKIIRTYGYLEEFLVAVKEEDEALQKIIEAYEKKRSRSLEQRSFEFTYLHNEIVHYYEEFSVQMA